MTNDSGLEPLGRAVLLRMYEPSERPGSLIQIPAHVKANATLMEQRGVVIAVGKSCWHDEPSPRAQPGDKVIVTRIAGYQTIGPKDGQLYRMVNDRDVFCKITAEEDHG